MKPLVIYLFVQHTCPEHPQIAPDSAYFRYTATLSNIDVVYELTDRTYVIGLGRHSCHHSYSNYSHFRETLANENRRPQKTNNWKLNGIAIENLMGFWKPFRPWIIMWKHSSFGFTVLLEHRMFESPAKSKNAYNHTRGGTMTGDATCYHFKADNVWLGFLTLAMDCHAVNWSWSLSVSLKEVLIDRIPNALYFTDMQ